MMTDFVCNECGYRFEGKENIRKCPYCSGSNVEKEKSAEELVNSIEVE